MPTVSGGLLALTASRRYSIPLVLWVQDLSSLGTRQTQISGGSRLSRWVERLESHLLRSADAVAIVSEGFRPHVEKMGVEPDRISHIPNWSHVQPPVADRDTTRASLGWAANEQIVLHAGNMGLKQGLEHVVRAAQLASNRGVPVRFVLMGDGNQRRHLESLAQGCDAITFLDPVSSDDFMNVLAAADVLLVNERASVVDMSLPSKLTSYFVAGRPVLAAVNPYGATAREVHRSEAGVTVTAEDPDALLDAVLELRSIPDRVKVLADAGPRYAQAHLGAKTAVDRFETMFNDIIERHRQASFPKRSFAFLPSRLARQAGFVSPSITSKDGHIHG